MASTFVTRLKVGEVLVDAKGVSRLVSRRVGVWPLAAFAVAGVAAIVVAILASPALAEHDRAADPGSGTRSGSRSTARRAPGAAAARPSLPDCSRVRLPLPRRIAGRGVHRARDRDPGRRRPLRRGFVSDAERKNLETAISELTNASATRARALADAGTRSGWRCRTSPTQTYSALVAEPPRQAKRSRCSSSARSTRPSTSR